MKKKNYTKKWICLLITLLAFIMLFSVNTFAKARKLPKVIRQYRGNGQLVSKNTYSYDSKGNITKHVRYTNYSGEDKTYITKFKITYWSKTSKYIKEMVKTSFNGGKTEYTFTKKGILKTLTQRDTSGKTVYTITFKLNGNLPVSSVQKDKKGNIITREIFDEHGNRTKRYTYENGVKTFTHTTKYTYRTSGKLKTMEDLVFNVEHDVIGTTIKNFNRDGTVSKDTIKYKSGGESVSNAVNTYNKAGYLTKKVNIWAPTDEVTNTYKFAYTEKTYDRRQPENLYVWGDDIEYILYR